MMIQIHSKSLIMRIKIVTILFCALLSIFLSPITVAQPITLKQKIGQLIIVGFPGTQLNANDAIVSAIKKQYIGGVVLYDFDHPTQTFNRNIQSPQQLRKLTEQLQHHTAISAQKNGNRFVPLLIAIDYEGGRVNRLKEAYGFPKTISAADIAGGSIESANVYAKQMAKTLKQAGINVNFAPVVDLNINPDNPIIGKIGRSFGSDPQTVVLLASIFSKAYRDAGIACSYKHFPGHGSSMGDTHLGFVDVTQTWQEAELDVYKMLLAQANSCPMVMTSHVVNKQLDAFGYPASLSNAMTEKLLKQSMHFDGVVVTDDLQMRAISQQYNLTDTVRLAMNSGADLLMFSNQLVATPQDPKQIVDMIYNDAMAGKISQTRIEDAYQRVMTLKRRLQ
jgi:beta-N-acetylhexosaminidase